MLAASREWADQVIGGDGPQALELAGLRIKVIPTPGPLLTFALEAREARLAQIEQAVRDGCRSLFAIAERLYGRLDERIRRPVEATVAAHVRYLRDVGRITWSEG